jgi:hypothetical protein
VKRERSSLVATPAGWLIRSKQDRDPLRVFERVRLKVQRHPITGGHAYGLQSRGEAIPFLMNSDLRGE